MMKLLTVVRLVTVVREGGNYGEAGDCVKGSDNGEGVTALAVSVFSKLQFLHVGSFCASIASSLQ